VTLGHSIEIFAGFAYEKFEIVFALNRHCFLEQRPHLLPPLARIFGQRRSAVNRQIDVFRRSCRTNPQLNRISVLENPRILPLGALRKQSRQETTKCDPHAQALQIRSRFVGVRLQPCVQAARNAPAVLYSLTSFTKRVVRRVLESNLSLSWGSESICFLLTSPRRTASSMACLFDSGRHRRLSTRSRSKKPKKTQDATRFSARSDLQYGYSCASAAVVKRGPRRTTGVRVPESPWRRAPMLGPCDLA
jgi:hypothetical protein